MNREVDIKALVSHLVRGDGAEKCRICMGATSEGQGYLGDTVMMDSDRAVTLADLLESITGVQVPLSEDLPSALCNVCLASAMAAAAFRTFCQQAAKQWDSTLQLLTYLPSPEDVEHKKAIYAIIANHQIGFVDGIDSTQSDSSDIDNELLTVDYIRTKRTKGVRLVKLKFHCPDCGKKFSCAQHLYTHLKGSTDYKRSCYVCASIMPQDELVKHLREIHQRVLYDCKKCTTLLQTQKQYNKHLHTAHSAGAYSCGDCGRSFQSTNAFYVHLAIHAARNCPGCDRLFRNHRCYIHHVKTCCNLDRNREDIHKTKNKLLFEVKNNNSNKKVKVGARGSADKECICDYCGKTCAGKKLVYAHIQIVHMKNTHKLCPYCGKSLAPSHMSQHIKNHEQNTTFRCEHCSVVLKSRLGYIQHLRLHTGEKPYTCKYCSESFAAWSGRSDHIRKMHKPAEQTILKNACEFCPARFRLPYILKRHMLAVHENKKSDAKVTFECPECHVKFGSCRGLLHHSRKHQTSLVKAAKKCSRKKVVTESKYTGEV